MNEKDPNTKIVSVGRFKMNEENPDTKILSVGRFEMELVEGKLGQKLRKDFFMFKDGVLIETEDKWILPINFIKYFKLISSFRFHSSDVVVLSFPRSGSTWVQEIVWHLIHNPNGGNPIANTPIDSRWPSFHGDMLASTTGAPPLSPNSETVRKFKMLYPGKQTSDGILLHLTALNRPPRLVKAHLPPCFFPTALPEMCKVIYIVREPIDVIKNLYLCMKLNVLYEYLGKREDFVDYFINDKMCFGPYWKHVRLGWNKRMHPNFLFLYYEDLKENLEDEVRKIDGFLGTRRTDTQITNIVKAINYKSLREKSKKTPPTPTELKFFNFKVLKENATRTKKGKDDKWELHLTHEEEEKLMKWRNRNLKEFDKDFRYKPM